MKTFSLALLLACLAVTGYTQESKKYKKAQAKAQAKIDKQREAEEGTSEQYNDWKDRPGSQEGYVIDAKGYKITGIIKANSASVKLIEPSGKSTYYQASECLEYSYDSHRFISTGKSFMEVIYDLNSIGVYKQTGPAFVPTSMPASGGGPSVMVMKSNGDGIQYFIRKKGQTKFEAVREINFAKKFSKYFADCPYLRENIKAKKFKTTKDDITAIAAIYDRECAPANK